MAGAKPITAPDNRTQPIKTWDAWRRERDRPLAARWPTPWPRASRFTVKGPGTFRSGGRCSPTPANFSTGFGFNRCWCLLCMHSDAGRISGDFVPMIGDRGRCLDNSTRPAVLLSEAGGGQLPASSGPVTVCRRHRNSVEVASLLVSIF